MAEAFRDLTMIKNVMRVVSTERVLMVSESVSLYGAELDW